MNYATLIPELSVKNCPESIKFYCDVLGFKVIYERKDEGFAFLERDNAQLMLDQINKGRTWIHPNTHIDNPLGHGVNFQIQADSLTPLLEKISAYKIPLFSPLEEKWYRRNDDHIGQRQFIVADPDGYLLRFYEKIGIKKMQVPVSQAPLVSLSQVNSFLLLTIS